MVSLLPNAAADAAHSSVKHFKRPLLHNNDFSPVLICCLCLYALSSFNYGFDVQAMAALQAMTPFARQFGVFSPKTETWKLEPYYLSLLNSCHAPAQILGVYVGSLISHRYGRRMCVFTMSLYAMVSSAIILSSSTKAQLLVGRTIHYAYLGMELASVPVALAEFAPARWRSSMVGLYWLSIKVGGLVISFVTRATSEIDSNLSWRIPVALFFLVPTIVASAIWLLPESPRWLLSKGRRDDAYNSLRRIRPKSASDSLVMEEVDELGKMILNQPKKGRFLEIFNRSHLRRTMIVAMANFFQQSTGQSFSSQYGTLFVKSLNSVNPWAFNMGNNAVNVGGIMLCLLLSDRIGRRPMIFTSSLLQIASLMTMGALGVQSNPSAHVREGIVSMILVFSFGYSVGWAPLTYLIGTEVPSPQKREHTLRFGYTVKLFMEFLVSFTYPYLEDEQYAGLGSKLGFIYGSVAVLSLICGYFFIPETRDTALEEIDEQLCSGVPTRKLRALPECPDAAGSEGTAVQCASQEVKS